MKAALVYILFLSFCLLCAHNHAHATAHYGKLSFSATHNTVHKQQLEAGNLIDVEDENDDKDVTKKLTHQAKWSSLVAFILSSEKPLDPSLHFLSQSTPLNHPGSDICIEQRVLRI